MNKKPVIKVLKREERSRARAASRHTAKKNPPADPTRKMVETVSGWVRDFKQKGEGEANNLLTTLFEKTPRANEA